ncbi:hypothetical protein [Phytohabitans houttuyneae]|uniref:hypothetical protein n=1 Tax=Phytohabitans houttuyneae TaxID=1076126 RepID=UPI001565DA35|nr:hypothetical protein [Phytohabitans houttuyneae]
MTAFSQVVIAVSAYEHDPPGALPEADANADTIVGALRQFGGGTVRRPAGESRADVLELLGEWATDERAGSSLIYWGGHGATDGYEHVLLCADTPYASHRVHGVLSVDLVRYLRENWHHRSALLDDDDPPPWTILVLDACGAGVGIDNIVAALTSQSSRRPRQLALLGTTGSSAGYSGRFAAALTSALARYTENDHPIRLSGLLQDIREELGDEAVLHLLGLTRDAVLPNPDTTDGVVTATLDVMAELRRLTPALRSHFLTKAQGGELGELAWYFRGRDAEVVWLAAWLRGHTDGLVVVTGRAGSGKSALLGRLVMLANPGLREAMVKVWPRAGARDEHRPPDNVFDVVLHLTGLRFVDCLQIVREGLTARLSLGPNDDVQQIVSRLRELNSGRSGVTVRVTVLADALDEAAEPRVIASNLLKTLGDAPGVRVIVGTRQSLREGPDLPAPTDRELLLALGDRATTIEVGADSDAAADYVTERLLTTAGSPYQHRERLAERIGRAVAGYQQPFLFARLAAYELMRRPPLDEDTLADQLAEVLDGGHRGLFRAAVERLTASVPNTVRALRALSFARGRGLPRQDRIWTTIAEATSPGERITPDDLDQVLELAAPYITLDGEDEQGTYRLAHQTFIEHFRDDPAGTQRGHRQAAFALIALAESRAWSSLNPYLTRYLPEHAVRGDVIRDLLALERASDHLDQAMLAAAVGRQFATDPAPPATAVAILRGQHRLPRIPVADRASYRALVAVTSGYPIGLRRGAATWWPRWTRMAPNGFALPLEAHTGAVERLATVGRAAPGDLLVSAGRDGTVRVVNPESGLVAARVHGVNGNPRAVAVTRNANGDQLLVAACARDTVAVWNLRTGEQLDRLAVTATAISAATWVGGDTLVTGGGDAVIRWWVPAATGGWSLAGASEAGAPVDLLVTVEEPGGQLLVCAAGGRVTIWDPATRGQVGMLSGNPGHLTAAVAVPPGLLATASNAGIEVWDIATGERRNVLASRRSGIISVASVTGSDGRGTVVAVDGDGALHAWDPLAPVRPPVASVGAAPISSVTVRPGDGRSLLAVGHVDGRIDVWPLDAGTLSATARGPVVALAAVVRDGQLAVAAAGEDGRVEVIDAATGATVETLPTVEGSRVRTLGATDRGVLLGGTDSGEVLVWRPEASGAPMRIPGHERPVIALAGYHQDGRLAVVSTDGGEQVRFTSAEDGQLLGRLTGPAGWCRAIAAATVDARTTVVLDIGGGVRFIDTEDSPMRDFTPLSSRRQRWTAVLPDGRGYLVALGANELVVYALDADVSILANVALRGSATFVTVGDGGAGTLLLAADVGRTTVQVWSIHDGAALPVCEVPAPHTVTGLVFLPGPVLVVGTAHGLFAVDVNGAAETSEPVDPVPVAAEGGSLN